MPVHARQSRPAISSLRAQQLILESRSQPRPHFFFLQVICHWRDQLIENICMDFIEGVAVHRSEIIPIRQMLRPFSVWSRSVEELDHDPEKRRRNQTQHAQQTRGQFRSHRRSNWIDKPWNPLISFISIKPKKYAPPIPCA